MTRMGIIDSLALAATLVFAIPVGLFGLQLLLGGRTLLGLLGVAIAVGLVLVERLLVTPADLPLSVVKRVVGRIVPEETEERP